ncbi:MAG: hypothetical protein QOI51_816 [Nocardioidaceae bacterium]|nr:hypothetical protein [Nocardioidaceae bacterium]
MRRLSVITLFMLALLPLRWFKVIASPAGTVYLHEVGLLLLTFVALATVRGRVFRVAVDRTLGFAAAMAAGFAVWGASCLLYRVSVSSMLKEVGYLVSFVVVVGIVILFAESRDRTGIRMLRWAGVVTTCTLILALGVALTINHINPATVFSNAVKTGNPSVIEAQLFRPAFAGFGYTTADAVSQLRHEVFAGLLVALLVASWAQHLVPFQSRSARWISQVAVVMASLLIVLSLSRSVQLAAVSWPLLALIRVVARGTITRRQVVALAGVTAVVAAVAASGFLVVIFQRVTQDSTSYTERGAKLGEALQVIGQYPWLGGHYDDTISSHNFVIDAWLRGGVLMAGLMLVALFIVVGRLLVNVSMLGRAPAFLIPVSAALVLPLVRMFTIGAGLLTPPEWVSLAFAFAATAVYEHELVRQRAATAQQLDTAPPVPVRQVVAG